jgi:hypothetical protein
MAKLIFEFESEDDMHTWMGYFSDGGAEETLYSAWEENEETDYPKIKVTREE